ncbi:hypothetical protein [Pseudobdellovibrio sp. HCB154]|uniref:hypothetical protein n=1 Tax=Pseudobdellovibrio sp. HCB154 TaxID=3386277 RepID=UPI0039172BA9
MESLSAAACETFIHVTEVEFLLGVISHADLEEREEILQWLMNDDGGGSDPRFLQGESQERTENSNSKIEVVNSDGSEDVDDYFEEPLILHLIPSGLNNKWVFTIGDSDNYPSVPHGHLDNKTRPWPKLNPYTGRAYSAKDSENIRYRLSRNDMIALWNNQDFRRHALEQIHFYRETYPHYRFPVPEERLRILPVWRRRRGF